MDTDHVEVVVCYSGIEGIDHVEIVGASRGASTLENRIDPVRLEVESVASAAADTSGLTSDSHKKQLD